MAVFYGFFFSGVVVHWVAWLQCWCLSIISSDFVFVIVPSTLGFGPALRLRKGGALYRRPQQVPCDVFNLAVLRGMFVPVRSFGLKLNFWPVKTFSEQFLCVWSRSEWLLLNLRWRNTESRVWIRLSVFACVNVLFFCVRRFIAVDSFCAKSRA